MDLIPLSSSICLETINLISAWKKFFVFTLIWALVFFVILTLMQNKVSFYLYVIGALIGIYWTCLVFFEWSTIGILKKIKKLKKITNEIEKYKAAQKISNRLKIILLFDFLIVFQPLSIFLKITIKSKLRQIK